MVSMFIIKYISFYTGLYKIGVSKMRKKVSIFDYPIWIKSKKEIKKERDQVNNCSIVKHTKL